MQKSRVCIVGLGYVGLPLACLVAKKGHEVFGFDISPRIIDATNAGKSHIADPVLEKSVSDVNGKIRASLNPAEVIPQADIVVVCVPTPVDEEHKPDLKPLESACETISRNMKKNQLIIIESTIYPGTTDEIVRPILEKSKLLAGKDFDLAHCPERIDPGNAKWNVSNIPRVVAGFTPEATKLTKEFYESIIDAQILAMNSLAEAEAVKMTENTFRDINIAFVNELALSFEKMGIDVTQVIKGASTKPFGYMPFYPGPGVGGHCIPVDPYYLIEKASEKGFNARFLKLAREVNNSMPAHVVELAENELKKQGKNISNSNIAVLGVAYKPNVDDPRESPALEIIKLLQEKNAKLKIYDPYIPRKSNVDSLDAALDSADLVLIATNHKQFLQDLTIQKLKSKKVPAVIDARNCLDRDSIISAGISYKGIGR